MLKKAFRDTVPVLFGYVPIGIAFGLLLTKSGYAWFYAVLMSIVIYSGANQFLAVGFLIKNALFVEIALVSFLLNLRHSFFGLSLIKKFFGTSWAKPYLIFALTDETYALLTSAGEPDPLVKSRYYFFVSFLNHLYWIVGTLVGALAGQMISADLTGLEFALTALFVVLTIEQYRSVNSLRPFVVALVAGISSLIFVAPGYMLLVSILIGTALLVTFRRRD